MGILLGICNIFCICLYIFIVHTNSRDQVRDFKSEIFRQDVFSFNENVKSQIGSRSAMDLSKDEEINYRRDEYKYFSGEYSLNKPPVNDLVDKNKTMKFCDERVIVYGNTFALLHDATMFPNRMDGMETQAKGGEEIRTVLNQGLEKENYNFRPDFFEMNCKSDLIFGDVASSVRLLRALRLKNAENEQNKNVSFDNVGDGYDHYFGNESDGYVIAIRREDYANMHNWVRNIYNTFLVMMHLRIQPNKAKILFMDGHPATNLDKAWSVIYSQPIRVGRLLNSVRFHNLILGIDESLGPVSAYQNLEVPFLEDFRSFVLSRFNLFDGASLNCLKLKITIIIRRNAVYHPRNIQGNVGRKIFNEAELVNDLMTTFPDAVVTPVLMESLPMRSQLSIISQSDVLIGMHGAGMTHVTFLPKHAAILEMFSKDFKNGRPWFRCYQSISRWRNMKYDSWENFDASLEMPADFTILPTPVIVNKTKTLVNSMCT